MVTGNSSAGGCIGNIGAIPRLGYLGLCSQDGPTALNRADMVSIFPAGLTAAASWDRDLIYERGNALANEFRDKGAHVVLGFVYRFFVFKSTTADVQVALVLVPWAVILLVVETGRDSPRTRISQVSQWITVCEESKMLAYSQCRNTSSATSKKLKEATHFFLMGAKSQAFRPISTTELCMNCTSGRLRMQLKLEQHPSCVLTIESTKLMPVKMTPS